MSHCSFASAAFSVSPKEAAPLSAAVAAHDALLFSSSSSDLRALLKMRGSLMGVEVLDEADFTGVGFLLEAACSCCCCCLRMTAGFS